MQSNAHQNNKDKFICKALTEPYYVPEIVRYRIKQIYEVFIGPMKKKKEQR